MMASCMFRTTYAMNTTNSLEEPFDNTFMFLILFTMFIGVFMWFAVTKLVTKAWTTLNSTFTKASTSESTTQVYETEFMDYTDTFTQTERRQDLLAGAESRARGDSPKRSPSCEGMPHLGGRV